MQDDRPLPCVWQAWRGETKIDEFQFYGSGHPRGEFGDVCPIMSSKIRRRGKVKVIDDKPLAVLESPTWISSRELAMLHLFNSYDFHLGDLQLILQGSYSCLKYICSEPILVWSV